MENKNCDHIYNWKHLFHRIGKVVKKAVQSGNRINMLRFLKLKARLESTFGPCLSICLGTWPWCPAGTVQSLGEASQVQRARSRKAAGKG